MPISYPTSPTVGQIYNYDGYTYTWNGTAWKVNGYYESSIDLVPSDQDSENRLVNRALTKFPIPYLSGLKLEADIRLEDLVLNTIDEEGVVWICTNIEGWWDFPEPQLPDLVRGWGDGSYDAKGRWNSRIITLKGTFLTQDPSQVPAARAKLIEAANLVYKSGVLVVNEEPAKSAFVRLSGPPNIETVTARGRTEFSIGLRAADPIKYEYIEDSVDGYRTQVFTPSSGTASATLTNLGNIEVPILIELSQGFTVSNPSLPPKVRNNTTDQEMSIIGSTVSTNRLEIDTYNREVLDVRYDSGEVVEVASGRSKLSTLSDWIYLEPGNNTIIISNFPAGSTCTIYYRSGWIG
jgi:phage-related protein